MTEEKKEVTQADKDAVLKIIKENGNVLGFPAVFKALVEDQTNLILVTEQCENLKKAAERDKQLFEEVEARLLQEVLDLQAKVDGLEDKLSSALKEAPKISEDVLERAISDSETPPPPPSPMMPPQTFSALDTLATSLEGATCEFKGGAEFVQVGDSKPTGQTIVGGRLMLEESDEIDPKPTPRPVAEKEKWRFTGLSRLPAPTVVVEEKSVPEASEREGIFVQLYAVMSEFYDKNFRKILVVFFLVLFMTFIVWSTVKNNQPKSISESAAATVVAIPVVSTKPVVKPVQTETSVPVDGDIENSNKLKATIEDATRIKNGTASAAKLAVVEFKTPASCFKLSETVTQDKCLEATVKKVADCVSLSDESWKARCLSIMVKRLM